MNSLIFGKSFFSIMTSILNARSDTIELCYTTRKIMTIFSPIHLKHLEFTNFSFLQTRKKNRPSRPSEPGFLKFFISTLHPTCIVNMSLRKMLAVTQRPPLSRLHREFQRLCWTLQRTRTHCNRVYMMNMVKM